MDFDKSDTDLKEKFDLLKTKEISLTAELKKVRNLQICINTLKMIPHTTIHKSGQSTITYSLPINHAGNEMKKDYRIKQKADLIINIDKNLGE